MLYRDTEISRQLAGERHDELRHDRRSSAAPAAARSPSLSVLRSWLAWLRTELRAADDAAARHAS